MLAAFLPIAAPRRGGGETGDGDAEGGAGDVGGARPAPGPAQKASASVITARRPIGGANGSMARMSQTPVLVLAAEDALAGPIAVAVGTAAA